MFGDCAVKLPLMALFAIAVNLVACSDQFTSSRLQSQDPVIEDAVVFFSSGFGSCGGEKFPAAVSPLINEMRQVGVRLRYVAACFDWKSQLQFSSTHFQGQTFIGSYSDIIALTQRELAETTSQSLYLVGHSYGGWLSLMVAEQLGHQASVRGIVTVDAMSPEHCYPTVVAKSYVEQGLGYQGEEGCLEAPRDWGRSRRENLRKLSAWWINFYQVTDRLIHSGSMEPAENFVVPYDESRSYNALAHRDIDTDDRVWRKVEDRVLDHLFEK